MMTDVYLYGALGEKYGRKHCFDIATAPQAAKALAANFKSFYHDFKDGFYNVRIGNTSLDSDSLGIRIGKGKAVHIIPQVMGSKKSGGIKVIAGIALLAIATGGAAAAIGPFAAGASGFSAVTTIAGFSVSYGSIATLGLTMALQGVSSLLTPVPKADYSSRNPVDQRTSGLFNQPTNRSAEGTPIPLVYGRFKSGSVVASAGMTVEQLL